MKFQNFHDWDVTPQQAVQIQRQYAGMIDTNAHSGKIEAIAGVDTAFAGHIGLGAVVILSYPALTLVEKVVVEVSVRLPYIPGLLSFREIPILLDAFKKNPERTGSYFCRWPWHYPSKAIRYGLSFGFNLRSPYNWVW